MVLRVPDDKAPVAPATCGSSFARSTIQPRGPSPEFGISPPGPAGDAYRTAPVPDQWELYDLDADPIETVNRWHDPRPPTCSHIFDGLEVKQARAVPERMNPWPYESRHPTGAPVSKKPPPPARLLRKALHKLGMHPDDPDTVEFDLTGKRALVVATNTAVMDIGKPTGVFASEMTVPYYAFLDAGMTVDVATPHGGVIPVDPQSFKPVIRCSADDRFLADDEFREKVEHSSAIGDLDMDDYDVVFLAGGWGAAYDLGFSKELARKMTEAYAAGKVVGGVCHGPLGLLKARDESGRPLVEGRRLTAVTDKQVKNSVSNDAPAPRTRVARHGRGIRERHRVSRPASPTTSSTATSSPGRTRTQGGGRPRDDAARRCHGGRAKLLGADGRSVRRTPRHAATHRARFDLSQHRDRHDVWPRERVGDLRSVRHRVACDAR